MVVDALPLGAATGWVLALVVAGQDRVVDLEDVAILCTLRVRVREGAGALRMWPSCVGLGLGRAGVTLLTPKFPL